MVAEIEVHQRSIAALHEAVSITFKYDPAAVEKALERASEGVRESAVAMVMRATSAYAGRDDATAAALFREATVKDPEYGGAWFGQG